ncbi:MAG: hypothetical protein ACI9DC_003141 [Gammaproteobacteria bacterium]|jgi:hypothetical protein
MKTLDKLLASLDEATCPATINGPLSALWHDAKGDWHAAHDAAQLEANADGAWVHAYLHRKEGDLPNANYWYRRAERTMPNNTLQQEWRDIATTLLDR